MYIFHLCYQGEKSRENKQGGGGSVEISPLLADGERGVENCVKPHHVMKGIFRNFL